MQHPLDAPSQGPALGPMIGLSRPNYETLDDHLGPFLAAHLDGEDLFVFVDIDSLLRLPLSDYGQGQLTRGELARWPAVLAAEMANLGGHYRNYAWRRYGRRATVLFYHSSQRCAAKVAEWPEYGAALYAKRLDAPAGEAALLRRFVDANLRVAKIVIDCIPHMYMVDTGELDPRAWPWALMAAGRCPGPAVVLSRFASDLQYALAPDPGGHGRAVLRPNGPGTFLVEGRTVLARAVRESKNALELSGALDPAHLFYLLALAGDADLGAPGLPRVGMAKAATMVEHRVKQGLLPATAPSLAALLEDGKFKADQRGAIERGWRLTVHQHHAAEAGTPAALAAVEAQLIDRSSLGQLEEANKRHFHLHPVSLDLVLAGEEY